MSEQMEARFPGSLHPELDEVVTFELDGTPMDEGEWSGFISITIPNLCEALQIDVDQHSRPTGSGKLVLLATRDNVNPLVDLLRQAVRQMGTGRTDV